MEIIQYLSKVQPVQVHVYTTMPYSNSKIESHKSLCSLLKCNYVFETGITQQTSFKAKICCAMLSSLKVLLST